MSKNTGGDAFPSPGVVIDNGLRQQGAYAGMTLRDYFAAAALQGILSGAAAARLDSPPYDIAAQVARHYSDALIKELSK